MKSITTTETIADALPATQRALACLALTILLASLGTSITNVALPEFSQLFNVPLQQVQWVVLAYLLSITTLVINMGRLGDLIGRRRLLLFGLALFTAASLLCGFVHSLWLLIAARAIQGVGAATMMALTMALVRAITPKEKTGRAMGLLGTMSAIGTALGPSLGGALLGSLGWQAIFFINLPLGLVVLVLAWRYLPTDQAAQNAKHAQFDYAGTILLIFTLVAYALSVTLSLTHAWLLLAAGGSGLFLWVESRAKSPLINLAILKIPALSTGFMASALVATVVMATLVVGPFYLSGALGLSPAQVGLAMSCGPVISALAGIPAGRLVDRFGAQMLSIAGLTSMLVGALSLSVLPARFGVAAYVVPLMITTAGYAVFQVSNNTSVMTSISVDKSGLVSGVLNLSRNIGLISGASMMGAIFAYGARVSEAHSTWAQAAERGMHLSFVVASVFILLALILVMLFNRRTSKIVAHNAN